MKNKVYYVSFLLCFFCRFLHAQSPGVWENYYVNDKIKVEMQEQDYAVTGTDVNKKLIVFKVTNLTGQRLMLSWQQEAKYGNVCNNCDGLNGEMNFQIVLEPGAVITGDGDAAKGKDIHGLTIFKEFNAPWVARKNAAPLNGFKIKNIVANSF